MASTYFCVGNYYHTRRFERLLQHLRLEAQNDDWAILVNMQVGEGRKPRGFAAVYNQLLTAAFSDVDCQFVWVLGDDIAPVGQCLRNTQRYLAEHSDVGVVFPTEYWQHGEDMITVKPFTGEVVHAIYQNDEPPLDQLFAGFACACIHRSCWVSVGKLDESLGRGYAEDLDWGIRCWQKGFKCVNIRQEWFHHDRGTTYNRLRDEGKYGADEPYEAGRACQKKWPFLWVETSEQIMDRMHEWYRIAHGETL